MSGHIVLPRDLTDVDRALLLEVADALTAVARVHVSHGLGHMTWAECVTQIRRTADPTPPTPEDRDTPW